MKCPNCNYVSHDYLDVCRSCGSDWLAFKAQVGLRVQAPGIVLDVGAVAAAHPRPSAPEIAMAPSGSDTGMPEAMPTLEFVEIEDEPSDGTGL